MFEDSLMESRVGGTSSGRRWTTVASMSLQLTIAGLVIAFPLLHPQAVSFEIEAPKMLLPLPPKPHAPPVRVQRITEAASNAAFSDVPRPAILSTLSAETNTSVSEEPALLAPGSGIAMPSGLPGGILGGGSHPSVSVGSAIPHKAVNISSGVSEGMLIGPIRPLYPSIARAAHVEGTVVVEATISRSGVIESLHVLSGPTMLRSAAIDAIRAARYRPYRLNGEAVDVQTTITVNFRMGA